MIQQEFMDQDPVQRIKAVSGEVSGQSFLHLYRLHGLVEWVPLITKIPGSDKRQKEPLLLSLMREQHYPMSVKRLDKLISDLKRTLNDPITPARLSCSVQLLGAGDPSGHLTATMKWNVLQKRF